VTALQSGVGYLPANTEVADEFSIDAFCSPAGALRRVTWPTRRSTGRSPEGDVPPILAIGSRAPAFDLLGIDDKRQTLDEYASSKVLVVIFSCNHCPVAQMYEKRIKELTSDYKNRVVSVVVIMGNDPKAIRFRELDHTDLSDTFVEMKIRAACRHFNSPYLYDGDTQKVALQYGLTATPHAFVFDQQRILRYQGRIDNNPREELVTKREARDAIDSLLAGNPVAAPVTPAVGCSTKWPYKEAGANEELTQSNQHQVSLEMISADQLAKLRTNAGSDRLLLVNFWATWCAPCVDEFPEIEKMVRMYVANGRWTL